MKFIRIPDSHSPYFKKVWVIYNYSFPPDEKRRLSDQHKIFNNHNYTLYCIKKNDTIMGLIAFWNLKQSTYIEHLAITKKQRNKGWGTAIISLIQKKYPHPLVVEAEHPRTKAAQRRMSFYQRLGFKLNNFKYIQPPYGKDKKSVPLLLVTYPERINKPQFQQFKKEIYRTAYCQ
jgi:hypothetical protein